MQTYYSILGVAESASESEMLTAYRKAIRKCHPDLNPTGSFADGKHSRQINTAKRILCDPVRRKKYDEYLNRKRNSDSINQNAKAGTDDPTPDKSQTFHASTEAKGPESPKSPRANSQFGGKRRNRNRKASSFYSLVQIVMGGFGGILIGLILIATFLDVDPFNLSRFWNRDIGSTLFSHAPRIAANVEAATTTASKTKGDHPSIGPNTLERLDQNHEVEPAIEPATTLSQTDHPDHELSIAGDPSRTTVEIKPLISPVSNSKRRAVMQLPDDVTKLEISFFGVGGEFASNGRRDPGYNGELIVNGKRVVSFARKYKWRDGKWYSYSLVHDGSEVNTRKPAPTDNQWLDLDGFFSPGEELVLDYRNGQKTGIGVKVRIHSTATSERSPK